MQIKNQIKDYPRREFIKDLAIYGGGLIILGSYGFTFSKDEKTGKLFSIIVDFDKCAGCRTCETVCSAFNNKVEINGNLRNGLGNPWLSRIKVYSYNPDVDIPLACANCQDAPCIQACIVEPDPNTGYKAIYRDSKSLTIENNKERCIGCGLCAKACKEKRLGVITPNPETNKPERICNHCNGDPQCVKYCPYEALAFQEIDFEKKYRGMHLEEIAKDLVKHFYDIEL